MTCLFIKIYEIDVQPLFVFINPTNVLHIFNIDFSGDVAKIINYKKVPL
jgi:hypothetical protein